MADGSATDQGPNPTVVLPELCFHCQRRIVKHCHLHPWDPWRAHIVVARLLLFSWVSSEDGIAARAEHEARNLTLILAELGCLGCARRHLFRDSILPLLAKGLSHAAKVPGYWERKAQEGNP